LHHNDLLAALVQTPQYAHTLTPNSHIPITHTTRLHMDTYTHNMDTHTHNMLVHQHTYTHIWWSWLQVMAETAGAEPGSLPLYQQAMDLTMLSVLHGGRERTLKVFATVGQVWKLMWTDHLSRAAAGQL